MTATDPESADALKSRLVALTRDLILIPTDATRPNEIERGFDFVCNHLESLGHLEITKYEHDGVPSIAAFPEQCPHPEIVLCGHLDVISHGENSAYRSRIENGRIYGPGAADMKGALAILLELFRSFHSAHPDASLGLIITSDEERGGESGMKYLFDEIGIRCSTAMIPDGGSLNEIIVEEKGFIHLKLRCAGQSAHAARPWLATNPLEILTDRLATLSRHFQSLKSGDDHWHPTCSPTRLDTNNRQNNRIPQEVEAVLDIRFPQPFTAEKILRDVTQILGAEVQKEVIIQSEPSHLSPDPLFLSITEEVTGQPATLGKSDGGSDARFLCRYDIPVIVSRPRVDNLHSVDEWIDIDSMATFHRIYETYLRKKLTG